MINAQFSQLTSGSNNRNPPTIESPSRKSGGENKGPPGGANGLNVAKMPNNCVGGDHVILPVAKSVMSVASSQTSTTSPRVKKTLVGNYTLESTGMKRKQGFNPNVSGTPSQYSSSLDEKGIKRPRLDPTFKAIDNVEEPRKSN